MTGSQHCAAVPSGGGHYTLANAHVPTGCIQGALPEGVSVCVDNLAQLDIEVGSRRGFPGY